MQTCLVDDDRFALKLLELQLRRLGVAEITCFDQASAALAAIDGRPGRFDLVFCDLQMPDMDGIEFSHRLAGLGYRGSLVVVSGASATTLEATGDLVGAGPRLLRSLQKPVSIDQLAEVLALHRAAGDA